MNQTRQLRILAWTLLMLILTYGFIQGPISRAWGTPHLLIIGMMFLIWLFPFLNIQPGNGGQRRTGRYRRNQQRQNQQQHQSRENSGRFQETTRTYEDTESIHPENHRNRDRDK